jgi:nucleotide-binding universal stress UspA family protein
MAMKDLLVCVDQSEDAAVRLRMAVDLAIRHESRLTALFAREWTPAQMNLRKAAELGIVPSSVMQALDDQVKASIYSVEAHLSESLQILTKQHGIRSDFLSIDGRAANTVPQYARYADICIVGQHEPSASTSISYTFSEQLLFVTGRPVLLVPPNRSFETLGRHIAVAWNSSRPAARSLNDAMPLIEKTDHVTIIIINPAERTDRHEGPPGEQLAEHIARHGRNAEIIEIEDIAHDEIAYRLQQEAQAVGADLIVAGAFGHPRLWEKMLGGVTRDLLSRMNVPLFMSH